MYIDWIMFIHSGRWPLIIFSCRLQTKKEKAILEKLKSWKGMLQQHENVLTTFGINLSGSIACVSEGEKLFRVHPSPLPLNACLCCAPFKRDKARCGLHTMKYLNRLPFLVNKSGPDYLADNNSSNIRGAKISPNKNFGDSLPHPLICIMILYTLLHLYNI